MIEIFFFFFVFYKWWLCFVYVQTGLDKVNNKALKWAAKIRFKLVGDIIFNSLECPFCRESHLGMIAAIPLACVFGWQYFLFGWMAKGLDITINQFKNKN